MHSQSLVVIIVLTIVVLVIGRATVGRRHRFRLGRTSSALSLSRINRFLYRHHRTRRNRFIIGS